MTDTFERDLRAWLDYGDELTRHTTVADRVVRNVETRTLERPVRGTGRARLLLVAAAVAAVLLAGIGLPHVLLRSQPGGSYPAGPPSNVPNRRPPAGMAIEWVKDPTSDLRIIAYDRGGNPVGWLHVAAPEQTGWLAQSGDGQRIVLTDFDNGGIMEVTAQGQRIALANLLQQADPWDVVFSDDDRTICMDQGDQGPQRNLVVFDPDGHTVHLFGEAPAGSPSYLSWHSVACSVRNDVAVLIGQPDPQTATSGGHSATGNGSSSVSMSGSGSFSIQQDLVPPGQPNYIVRVVRLSTGVELARRTYTSAGPEPIDATDDGTLVLERDESPNTYTLRNIVTGAIARTLHADVRGLFGGRFAISEQTGSSLTSPVTYTLIDVRTGEVAWQSTFPRDALVSYMGHGRAVLVVQRFMGPSCPEYALFDVKDLTDGSEYSQHLYHCPP